MCPAVGRDITPVGAMFGIVPDISHLRVFGARCYVQVPGDKRSKLAPRAEKGRLLGHAHKGAYRVLLSSGEVVESRDVKVCDVDKMVFTKKQTAQQKHVPEDQGVTWSTLEVAEGHSAESEIDGHSKDEFVDFEDHDDEGDGSDNHKGYEGTHEKVQDGSENVDNSDSHAAPLPSHSGPALEDNEAVGEDNVEDELDEDHKTAEDVGVVLPRRSGRIKKKPYLFLSPQLYSASADVLEPGTLNEAMKCPDAERWKSAIQSELDALTNNQTWELVRPPNGAKLISSR